MGDAMVVVDERGSVTLANPAAERMLGAEVRQVPLAGGPSITVATAWTETLCSEPGKCRSSAPWAAKLWTPARCFCATPRAQPDVRLSITARPVREANGRLAGAVAVFRDVTERSRAAEDLAVQRLSSVLEASGVVLGSLESGGGPAFAHRSRAADRSCRRLRDLEAPRRRMADRLLDRTLGRISAAGGRRRLIRSTPPSCWRTFSMRRFPTAGALYGAKEFAPCSRALVPARRLLRLADFLCPPIEALRRDRDGDGPGARKPGLRRDRHRRLYEQQMRMRARAEEAERRSTLLTEATGMLGSSLDYETTLAQVARMAVPHFADRCGIEMAQPDGSTRLMALAHADPAKAERGLVPDLGHAGLLAEVFHTGRLPSSCWRARPKTPST